MKTASGRRALEVQFNQQGTDRPDPHTPAYKRFGGCGMSVPVGPYDGPRERVLHRSGHVFVVTRVDRSPTGAYGGSFLIQETVVDPIKREPILRFIGYNYSWPDSDVCVRLIHSS